jgi:hypothetical protein
MPTGLFLSFSLPLAICMFSINEEAEEVVGLSCVILQQYQVQCFCELLPQA